jgi:hypothetical protein
MVLDAYTYVFAIGSIFALLEAYNNGASKSSRFASDLPAPHHNTALVEHG